MKASIKESRAQEIINSAEVSFFKKGYSQSSISDICQLCKCSRTTVYTYFGSKENLYLEVTRKALDQFLSSFTKVDTRNKSGKESLIELAHGYLKFASTYPQQYQLMLDFYQILRSISQQPSLSEEDKKMKAANSFKEVRKLSQIPLQYLEDLISAGQLDGSINKELSAREHMLTIWSYLKGYCDISPLVEGTDLEDQTIRATINKLMA